MKENNAFAWNDVIRDLTSQGKVDEFLDELVEHQKLVTSPKIVDMTQDSKYDFKLNVGDLLDFLADKDRSKVVCIENCHGISYNCGGIENFENCVVIK